ncbi:MAG: hypothetical protein ACRDTD_16260 [Pseudonocardiaceae bacterium]
MNPTDYRPSHQLLCELLRRVLRNAVQAGPGAAVGIGTVECQAVAALYLLLIDHPIDQRAAAGPAATWRRCSGRGGAGCRVYAKAIVCLHQLDEVLLRQLLAHE